MAIISKYNQISLGRIFLPYFFIPERIVAPLDSVGPTSTIHNVPSIGIADFGCVSTMKQRVFFKTFAGLSTFDSTISRWRWNYFNSTIFAPALALWINGVSFDLVERWRHCVRVHWFVEVVVSWVMVCCGVCTSYAWIYGFLVANLAICWVTWSHI